MCSLQSTSLAQRQSAGLITLVSADQNPQEVEYYRRLGINRGEWILLESKIETCPGGFYSKGTYVHKPAWRRGSARGS